MKMLGKIWWVPLLVYIFMIPSFMNVRISNAPCKKIDINVRDSLLYSFVTSEDIYDLINNETSGIVGKSVSEKRVAEIERNIKSIRELQNAEVYMTVDGTLNVDADQRDPVMRLISSYGNSYFIDRYGYVIPHEYKYTPRLIVVSGNIEMPEKIGGNGNILLLPEGSLVKEIFSMVTLINRDQFWRDQIEQIWVDEKNELQLIPRVGQILIRFGSTGRMENKLVFLEQFYKDILPLAGWNKYKEVSVKYEGQIICTKR